MKPFNLIKYNICKFKYKLIPNSRNFYNFKIYESYILNEIYFKKNIIIHNSDAIKHCRESGAIITFIHYGSFFLIGPTLIHQKNCKYTAIASLDNNHGKQLDLWESFHSRYNKYYSVDLILRTSYMKTFVSLLKSSFFIGIALDVHTKRKKRNIKSFTFKNKTIYLDDYVSELSLRYSKPVIACTICFNRMNGKHDLYLSDAYEPGMNMSNDILSFIDSNISESTQYFHDLFSLFSTSSMFK